MKKIVLNINDALYEKFRFQAIADKKSVQDSIAQAIREKAFDIEVEHAYNEWVEKNILEMMSK